jgi:hypothetical protein
MIISRHVVLDESSFPFAEQSSVPTAVDFEFLDDFTNVVQAPIGPPQLFLPAGSVISGSPPAALPRAAPDAPPPAVSDPLPRAAGPCSSPLSHCHVRPPARLLRLWATCCRMQQGPLQPSPAGRGAQQATSNAPAVAAGAASTAAAPPGTGVAPAAPASGASAAAAPAAAAHPERIIRRIYTRRTPAPPPAPVAAALVPAAAVAPAPTAPCSSPAEGRHACSLW